MEPDVNALKSGEGVFSARLERCEKSLPVVYQMLQQVCSVLENIEVLSYKVK